MHSHHRPHSHHSPHSNHTRAHLNGTSLNLYIPSLHDATPLEACLIVPHAPTSTRKAAVIAHPYGPLGGSLNDPTVQFLAAQLVSLGHIVAIFNFRGTGHSKGHTSWTGRAETADYAAVATWVLNFSASLHPSNESTHIDLVLAGYSYGSLIAAQCPPVEKLMAHLSAPPTTEFADAIKGGSKTAQHWYESHSDVGRTSYSGVRSPPRSSFHSPPSTPLLVAALERAADDAENLSITSPLSPPVIPPTGVRPPATPLPLPPPSPLLRPLLDPTSLDVKTLYILISPPLPPISVFLLPSFSYTTPESVVDPTVAKSRGARVFAAWGDDDGFTGVKKYQKWSGRMEKTLARDWGCVQVRGGHFWGEEGLREVGMGIGKWIKGTERI